MKKTEYQKALATAVKKGWETPPSSPLCGGEGGVIVPTGAPLI